MSARAMPTLIDRVAIAGRVLLAALGGYAVAALASALLALLLPLPRAEAVSAGTLASFAIMAGAVIWVFAARTLGRATLGLGLTALLLTGALWLAGAFAHGPAA
ncbi:iron transporter [Methylobacterium sp. C33D]